jgi:hypothetical protein
VEKAFGHGTETIRITQKGADGVNRASVQRGTPTVLVSAGQVIHVNCRKKHIDQKCIKLAKRKRDSDIDLLGGKFQAAGITTLHGDADLLIAKTAVEYATTGITRVIGEDTDISVALPPCKARNKGSVFQDRQIQSQVSRLGHSPFKGETR